MKSSGISSARPPHSQPYDAPPRRSFALTGKSVAFDPRLDAVRPDLADIRLADRIFAPHYAAPVARSVLRTTGLRVAADATSDLIAELVQGEPFEVLEFARGTAWGRSPTRNLVGYVDADALNWPAE